VTLPQPCAHEVQECVKVIRKTDLKTGSSGRIVGYEVMCVKCSLKITSYEPDDAADGDGKWSTAPLLHNGKGVYNLKVIRRTSHLTPRTSHLTPHSSHLTHHTSHITHHTSHLLPPPLQAMHDYAELHANNAQKMWQLAKRNPMGSNRGALYGNRWPVVRW
jgi:hypothetical protein